jgi:spermidine synthase
MVHIDKQVVRVRRRFLPSLHRNYFDDSRAEFHCAHARKYLEGSGDKFNATIIALADFLLQGLARLPYTQEFYRIVK